MDHVEQVEYPKLIPTQNKWKLPKGWCYPIGAEALSEAMRGMAEYDRLYAQFYFSEGRYRKLWERSLVGVLEVAYRSHHWKHIEGELERVQEQNWTLEVKEVPSELKPTVKRLLVEAVLPAARAWIGQKRTPLWYEESKTLEAFYHLDTETLEYKETGRI